MPPVSWPTASIFCDWRRASSAFCRAENAISSSRLLSRTRSSRVSAKARMRALLLGDIHVDPIYASRLPVRSIKDDVARIDPSSDTVIGTPDPKLSNELPLASLKHLFD